MSHTHLWQTAMHLCPLSPLSLNDGIDGILITPSKYFHIFSRCRIIMLRESKGPVAQTRASECDCGILKEISEGLEEVIASKGS